MTLQNTNIFVNLSKSKKAIVFSVDEVTYELPISHITDMVNGQRKTTTLSIMTKDVSGDE